MLKDRTCTWNRLKVIQAMLETNTSDRLAKQLQETLVYPFPVLSDRWHTVTQLITLWWQIGLSMVSNSNIGKTPPSSQPLFSTYLNLLKIINHPTCDWAAGESQTMEHIVNDCMQFKSSRCKMIRTAILNGRNWLIDNQSTQFVFIYFENLSHL